ncbi:hypothetical protein RSAG8_02905, partial [Rhizoctonia solani AG-8 WAC10335]
MAERTPIVDTASQKTGEEVEQESSIQEEMPRRFSRNTYTGALFFNILAFILPALYDTLVKIWISKIDSSFVVTTDAYTYISTIVEVLNEGLPQAAYLVIGDPVMPLAHRVNLVFTLDFIFLSTFRVRTVREPTINTQASIRMACNGIGCIAGLLYFIYVARRLRLDEDRRSAWMPKWSSFVALAKPGVHTLLESAVRNALYLWLIHGIVNLGSDYATAWGIFNTIRWGLVMVPVNALAATSATFVGHEWGLWRERALTRGSTQASLSDIVGPRKIISSHKSSGIFRPALRSTFIALITAQMWRTIDWCYIMYGTDTQLAAILLATRPKWYLVNSLIVNILWVFPWAVALQVGIPITESSAWKYHSIVFGGSLVMSFIVTIATVVVWAIWLLRGKVKKL